MITEENVTAIPWSDFPNFRPYDDSDVNDWLNNYFYPKLEHKDLLVNSVWCSEKTEDATSSRTSCVNNQSFIRKPVGLISIDEMNLSQKDDSFLNNQQAFYLINSDNWMWFNVLNQAIATNDSESCGGVRPVVNIKADVIIVGGNGTLTDPYLIGEVNDVTGSLKDNSHVGEYVNYAGRNYRVVETSNQGTKLILDGYYDSNNDGVINDLDFVELEYNADNCYICDFINSEDFINNLTYSNVEEQTKLSTITWYQGDSLENGDSYKKSLESTSNPYEGRVGLIRVGEMLSGQSETILSKNHTLDLSDLTFDDFMNYTYFTITSFSDYYYFTIGPNGYLVTLSFGQIRPVIMIGPDVQILGGNGTFNSPFQI